MTTEYLKPNPARGFRQDKPRRARSAGGDKAVNVFFAFMRLLSYQCGRWWNSFTIRDPLFAEEPDANVLRF
ncbi:hypothetical protein [Nitrobacter sp. JJSN]|jgi:hypothetical protein|uniref:hypothetical protein n=1 Tax=Nitrobacter sp. JJSN TaxID=3453033 RepID=UPI003F75A4DD